MANCAYCDTFILMGGKTDQTGRYCNNRCQQAGNLLAVSQQIPRAELDRQLQEIYRGNCPKCGGLGPVDVHKSHLVWSALIVTSSSSKTALSCKSCASKRQLGAILFCGVFGWWGFPWGIGMTPLQIARNIGELAGGPQPGRPSPLLEKVVRMQAADRFVREPKRSFPKSEPPPLPSTVTASAPRPDNDERYMPKAAKG